uniref:Uncharacterized protein n=1 Tax=Chromera velia CCMP2878 TaxID=1169474 RepID=A0A0G4G2Y3_9ALVE|eukprot:Cvel_19862.t1-p1 / transcript=Cvel_19862.t1 / gene=Cvel_19862 / organism=Chromera_velia_CCMP2878 / gene_product=hypothetical protein / transcript_product=hypothetical protein / location=Cvel_scaffold1741:6379-6726(+) / protein_length=116 / sequence_SO=supercontig / SO=protein_coding / is_pseudo=false
MGDKRRYDTYAGVPSLSSILIYLVFLLILGARIFSCNVKQAFQQVDDVHHNNLGAIAVKIPYGLPTLPEANPFPSRFTEEKWQQLRTFAGSLLLGTLRFLNKAHYGGRNGSNLFVL